MCMLVINIFSSGTMIAFENNLAKIAKSYIYPTNNVTNLVFLMCVSRYFGTLLIGNLKSKFLRLILSSIFSFLALAIEGRGFFVLCNNH